MSRNSILKPVVFAACLVPLGQLLLGAVQGSLGANPIERITHETGHWTLILLLVTLAITPLRRLSGILWLIQYRRMLGLFAFFYGTLHLLTYVWLDQFFNVGGMLHDIGKRPFITVGMLTWVLLLPLAITSTKAMIRRLGKRWQMLHRLVYLTACTGVLHYYWAVKKDVSRPLQFAAVASLLLGWRLAVYLVARIQREAAERVAVTSD